MEYGVVGSIQDSCQQVESCKTTGYQGTVGSIQHSCNSYQSCYYAGSYGGSIGSITSSCNANKACYKAGKDAAPSAISSSLNGRCCNTANACYNFSEVNFVANRLAVCSVRECNICSPCFLLHSIMFLSLLIRHVLPKKQEAPTNVPTIASPTFQPTNAPTPSAPLPATVAPTQDPFIATLPSVGGCPP